MSQTDLLHLVIAAPSEADADALVGILREAGYVTRAQHVADIDGLEDVVARRRWDLMLCCRGDDAGYEAAEMIRLVLRSEHDVPVILVETESDPAALTAGLALGASDVVLPGEQQRLVLIVEREFGRLTDRRRRRQVEVRLRQAERQGLSAIEACSDPIALLRGDRFLHANPPFLALLGRPSVEALVEAETPLELIPPADREQFSRHLELAQAEPEARRFELRLTPDGEQVHQGEALVWAGSYNGQPCAQLMLVRGAHHATPTTPHRTAAASEADAGADAATGMMNRTAFLETLDRTVRETQAGHRSSALVMLQLDDFPALREQLSAAGIDQVLARIAGAVEAARPENAVLARLGDDTFAALLADQSASGAEAFGARLRRTVAELGPEAEGQRPQLGASVGIAPIGSASESAQEALDQASRATTHAREGRGGSDGVYVFDARDFTTAPASRVAEEDERGAERLRRLNESLRANSLVLLFEPVVSLQGAEREHYEVFLRLPDADGELLPPEDFMPLAARAGMGGRIDRWVVLHAIKRLARRRTHDQLARLTINLSQSALLDENFQPWLRVALKAAKLPKECLALQFSEMAAVAAPEAARSFCAALEHSECTTGLSHFGASVNPFATLQPLAVSHVKLDEALIEDLHAGNAAELGETIRALHEHGKQVSVPGVSNAHMLAQLFQYGADFVQGSYFQEPGPEMDYDFSTNA